MIVTQEQMLRWIQCALIFVRALVRAFLLTRRFVLATFNFLTGAVFMTRPPISRDTYTQRYHKFRIRSNVLCQPCHREHHHAPSRPDTAMSRDNVEFTPRTESRSVTPVPSRPASLFSESLDFYEDDAVVPDGQNQNIHHLPLGDNQAEMRPYVEIETSTDKNKRRIQYHG